MPVPAAPRGGGEQAEDRETGPVPGEATEAFSPPEEATAGEATEVLTEGELAAEVLGGNVGAKRSAEPTAPLKPWPKQAPAPGQAPPGPASEPPPKEPEVARPINVEDAFDPLGEIAPTEKYIGPSAGMLYQEGQKAWAEYAANEFKVKAKARDAARRLKEIFLLLDKNPDSETQMKALEQVVGLTLQEVLDGTLEKRLRS
jgi:hypothetical protein